MLIIDKLLECTVVQSLGSSRALRKYWDLICPSPELDNDMHGRVEQGKNRSLSRGRTKAQRGLMSHQRF